MVQMWEVKRNTALIFASKNIAPENNSVNIYSAMHKVVDDIGAEGVSSDESDSGDRAKEAIVRLREWRSPGIHRIMKHLDLKRGEMRSLGAPKGGSIPHPRTRRANANKSERGAVAKLPINWYNPAWYDSLDEGVRRELQAKKEAPLPVITDEMLR